MNNPYDRIRWFLFVQDQMTKKQLVLFAKKSLGLSGFFDKESDRNVDFTATKEDLKNQINIYLRLDFSHSWETILLITESNAKGKHGELNYDPEWTPIEPEWEHYSEPPPSRMSAYGIKNIKDDAFYKLLIGMEYKKEEVDKKYYESRTSQAKVSSFFDVFLIWDIYGVLIIIGFIYFLYSFL